MGSEKPAEEVALIEAIKESGLTPREYFEKNASADAARIQGQFGAKAIPLSEALVARHIGMLVLVPNELLSDELLKKCHKAIMDITIKHVEALASKEQT